MFTDTRAYSCLYTLIQNGHLLCKHYILYVVINYLNTIGLSYFQFDPGNVIFLFGTCMQYVDYQFTIQVSIILVPRPYWLPALLYNMFSSSDLYNYNLHIALRFTISINCRTEICTTTIRH